MQTMVLGIMWICEWLEFLQTIKGASWCRWTALVNLSYPNSGGIHRWLKPEIESQLDESNSCVTVLERKFPRNRNRCIFFISKLQFLGSLLINLSPIQFFELVRLLSWNFSLLLETHYHVPVFTNVLVVRFNVFSTKPNSRRCSRFSRIQKLPCHWQLVHRRITNRWTNTQVYSSFHFSCYITGDWLLSPPVPF